MSKSRKSPEVAKVLPLLYLHGLSSDDFAPALEQFLGSAAGLSAATFTRMTTQWQDDANAFNRRSLAETDYVYCWVDGIHLKVRLGQDKACLLVMIGVRGEGTKELIALAEAARRGRSATGPAPSPAEPVRSRPAPPPTARRPSSLPHRSVSRSSHGTFPASPQARRVRPETPFVGQSPLRRRSRRHDDRRRAVKDLG